MVPTKGGVHAVCYLFLWRRSKEEEESWWGVMEGEVGTLFPITLYYIFPSSLCVGTSSDVSTKRPSTGSPGCSYQPPNPRAPPPDSWLRLPAPPPGPSPLRCRPSPRSACSFGSWDICRPGPSCAPTGCCRLASGARPGFCTPTPSWPRTWPSPQRSPCPGRLLGPLKTQSHEYTLVNTSNNLT